MASNTSHRPSPLRSTKSFPRADPPSISSENTRPKRASTLHNGADAAQRSSSSPLVKSEQEAGAPDTFESRISEEAAEPPRASVDLDNLPIELISLTDRFIEQLSAKVHPSPPNVEKLSRMFQDFYVTAATHIQTHVDSLATRQRREASPIPSSSTRQSAANLLRAKAASLGHKDKPRSGPVRQELDQQMLTAEEVANRRRARKVLEQQKSLMEEAVERRLCEGIYNKIYRHRTTQDEAQDDKLRSKTAALAVVGISPADLGVELGGDKSPEAVARKHEEVRISLEAARRELVLMNESRYPLGKLNHLKAAHKSIIDTLSHFHPSSSADELMPMLIYTLITLPPENLNVISDVNFIQRFRGESKLMGEAAYCLTSLEATISFLETVDLSTLRADEAPTGPLKSVPGTPKVDTFPPAYSSAAMPVPAETTLASGSATLKLTTSSTAGLRAQLRNRRLSDLVNTPAQAFNAASDAVLLTADQGLKTISTSLGDSYKFLLGKLREHPEALITGQGGEPIVPKTLEDARKLIGTPPPATNDDDGESASGTSSVHCPEDGDNDKDRDRTRTGAASREDKVLNLITGGRKVSRDHSADSVRSGGSSKRAVSGTRDEKGAAAGAASALDSVRNLGNSLNPMARLSAGIGGFRGFGRSTPSTPAPTAVKGVSDGGDLATVCSIFHHYPSGSGLVTKNSQL